MNELINCGTDLFSDGAWVGLDWVMDVCTWLDWRSWIGWLGLCIQEIRYMGICILNDLDVRIFVSYQPAFSFRSCLVAFFIIRSGVTGSF